MPEQIPTIEIDMDKECSKCHEKGATHNGLCLSCNTDLIIGHETEVRKFLDDKKAKEANMLDAVSFEGVVSTTSTNWPKNITRIAVTATYAEAGEIEAESLGEYVREQQACDIVIAGGGEEDVKFRGHIESVHSNWAKGETTVTFSNFSLNHEFETKSAILGTWGAGGRKVTVRVNPAQGRLL